MGLRAAIISTGDIFVVLATTNNFVTKLCVSRFMGFRSLPASYTYSRNTSDQNGLVYNWLREAWRELRLGHTIMTTLVMLS